MLFEELIKLVESFKKNQISQLMDKVSTKVFEVINSDRASPEIAKYFKTINAEGPPFTDFSLEPDNISQIKKLLNALYYARLTFISLENLDIREVSKSYANFNLLRYDIIENAYEATYLLTHVDVDVTDMFKEELDLVLPYLGQIQKFAESGMEETTKAIKTFPFSYKAGEITGIAADQLRPIGGDVDYNFLTQFGAILPSYIEQLTQYIEKFSSDIKEKEPKLNKEKLDEIQNAALNLLNDIEKLQGGSVFMSFKFLNYIHILRNLFTLSTSALEQFGELSESSQDLVRDKLAQLKYTILPSLFGLVDKIEVNMMLKPGTLSIPLMEQVQKLYQALIYLPSKAIDFKAKGEELLKIEDSRFIELRLELAYKRIDAANKELYKTKKAQDALDDFFAELENPEYAKFSLSELPADVKTKLITQYKIIKPYMARVDVDLNEQIIAGMSESKGWSSYVWNWATGQLAADHVSRVLAKKQALQNLISKSENSQEFHIRLNKDLIDSVHREADLALFPYSEKTGVYVLNESIPLNLKPEQLKLKLNKSEFLPLRFAFEHLTTLIQNQITTEDILSLNQLDEKTKKQLLNLYNKLHPYFSHLVPKEQKDAALSFDRYLTTVLSNKTGEIPEKIPVRQFTELMNAGLSHLNTIRSEWPDKVHTHYDLEQEKFLSEEESKAYRLAENKKLKFVTSDENILLKNPEQLTADQALELCQWYRNKHNKFQVTQRAYVEFIELLKAQNVTGNTLNLIGLDDKIKERCRNLYSVFQPYFISSTPAELKDNAINLDKFLVAALSIKKIIPPNNPSIGDLLALDTHFQDNAAQQAYIEFTTLLKAQDVTGDLLNLATLGDEVKDRCRILHRMFQPGLTAAVKPEMKGIALNCDKFLTHALSIPQNATSIDSLLGLNAHFHDPLMQQAYVEFIRLLKTKNIKGSVLNLLDLDDTTKDRCRDLYSIFQFYLVSAAPLKVKDEARNLNAFLVTGLTTEKINPLEAPSIESLLELNTQFPNPVMQQAYVEFIQLLKAQKIKGSLLNLIGLDEVIKDKCRDLYQIFQARFTAAVPVELQAIIENMDQFLVPVLFNRTINSNSAPTIENLFLLETHFPDPAEQQAYTQFIRLLKDQKVKGSILNMINLDKKIKSKCQGLYQVFQPHFISVVKPELQNAAVNFDKFLTSVLSISTIDPEKAPSVEKFLELDADLQNNFARVHLEWHQKSQTYYELAQEKFLSENETTKLELETDKRERAHHLLKDTVISASIHDFRTAMWKMTALFNESMKKELIPQESGVPFPEMEDFNQQLRQGEQVCAIKDIYNSLFHLEGIALELEQLTDEELHGPYANAAAEFYAKKKKFDFMRILLRAYGHINEITELGLRLSKNPHYQFMAQDVIHKAQNIYATLQKHSDAYQVAPSAEVQLNPLWYVLNAFYIAPKHIRSLKNTNYLTAEELKKLHQGAEKATLIVQGIINNSDNYFKLFLQAPNMIFLYRELTRKLNEFTTTTHDAVLNNLDKIRSGIFTPMLLEADLWEERGGLVPGSISEPLRKITDEYFKGLLHPLDLHSQKHVGLICDKKTLEQRTTAVTQQISNTKTIIADEEKYYADIAELHHHMKQYKELSQGYWTAAQDLDSCKTNIVTTYKKVLPKLAQLKLDKKISIQPSMYDEDHVFDTMCNQKLKEYDPQFTEIEAWVTASYNYSLGLKATHEMSLHGAEEKHAYLTKLETTQDQENQKFVEDYTTEAFGKHLDALCNRHIGLQYVDTEYRNKLRKYLLTFKTQIISESKTATDINLNIQTLLKAKISFFEKQHYEEYYHLDSVRVALARFKIYFNHATINIQNKFSLFESNETLGEKSALINGLEQIATNTELSIEERLKKIKAGMNVPNTTRIVGVNDPSFERIILKHKHADTFTFTYLLLCIVDLLEALHLYTPTRKKLLNNIKEAVNNPPKIDVLTKRFGLFAKPTPSPSKEPDIKPDETIPDTTGPVPL